MINGKAKGSAWERDVCKALSLWLTKGQRPDILTRNVLSGGRFTNALRKDSNEKGMPGDVMAAHPLAFKFNFLVECKHLNSLSLEAYLFDHDDRSPLAHIINQARQHAAKAETPLHFMIVAKQNQKPPLVFVDNLILEFMQDAHKNRRGIPSYRLPFHHLHSQSIGMFRFQDLINCVDPDKFLAMANP